MTKTLSKLELSLSIDYHLAKELPLQWFPLDTGCTNSTLCDRRRDTSVGIAARGTIFQVALDRASHLSQLTSDLMMTASHKVHFQKCIMICMTYHLILQYRFLRILHLMVVSIAFILLFVSYNPMSQCRLCLLGIFFTIAQ